MLGNYGGECTNNPIPRCGLSVFCLRRRSTLTHRQTDRPGRKKNFLNIKFYDENIFF